MLLGTNTANLTLTNNIFLPLRRDSHPTEILCEYLNASPWEVFLILPK